MAPRRIDETIINRRLIMSIRKFIARIAIGIAAAVTGATGHAQAGVYSCPDNGVVVLNPQPYIGQPQTISIINAGTDPTVQLGCLNYTPNALTFVLIHGWQSNPSTFGTLAQQLQNIYPLANVISIDWKEIANAPGGDSSYFYVAGQVPYVAQDLATALSMLAIDPSMIKLIGHSLGAHVAGFASADNGNSIGEIVGLDPAAPFDEWFNGGFSSGLSHGQAQRVAVIHSSNSGCAEGLPVPPILLLEGLAPLAGFVCGGFGNFSAIGDVDVYIKTGTNIYGYGNGPELHSFAKDVYQYLATGWKYPFANGFVFADANFTDPFAMFDVNQLDNANLQGQYTIDLIMDDGGTIAGTSTFLNYRDGSTTAPRIEGPARPFGYVDSCFGAEMLRVPYRGADGDLHAVQVQLGGSWQDLDLSSFANPGYPGFVAGNPSMFGSPCGNPSIVYAGSDNHIHQVQASGSNWIHTDLSDVTGGVTATGNPSTVVFNGTPMIFLRSQYDTIYTFVAQGGSIFGYPNWAAADLFSFIQQNPGIVPCSTVAGDVFAYVSSDGVLRVIYRGQPCSPAPDGALGSDIYEFSARQGTWYQANLSTITTNGRAYPAAGDPFGYVDANGILRDVYRGMDGHIYEIRWDGAWYQADLSALANASTTAAGDPRAYVDANGVVRVVYRGPDNDIHEIRWEGGWYEADLSALANASTGAAGDPFGYVDLQGTRRVVFTGKDSQIHEIYYGNGMATWVFDNLSNPVGTAPASVQAFLACWLDNCVQP